MKNLKQFIGLYPVSKTLRFKLVPIGKTAENIEKNGMLDRDAQKAADYPAVKALIDDCHKYFLNEALRPCQETCFDWLPLKKAIETYQKDKTEENKKSLETLQNSMRKDICKRWKSFDKDKFKELDAATPSKLLKDEEWLNKVFNETLSEKNERTSFLSFASYFKGFQENRHNIYTSDAISTSVAFRIVHDNFPKFLADIEVYNAIKELCPEVLVDAEKELRAFLDGVALDDVFKVEFYNSVLNQSGISYFNQIIGGVTTGEGEQKLRGINEFVNLYRQQHPELRTKKKGLTMIPLFKQILSDRETLSFIPQTIENDNELVDAIKQFHKQLSCTDVDGEQINVVEQICALLDAVCSYDAAHIYVNGKSVTNISQKIFKNWGYINEHLRARAITTFGPETKSKATKKKIDAYLKQEAYSFEELSCAGVDIKDFYSDNAKLSKVISDMFYLFDTNIIPNGTLKSDAQRTEIIKNLLDAYMELLHKAETLVVAETLDLDKGFYNRFFVYYEILRSIVPLYTKVRNYLTQKPYEEKKFKLNFDTPTLANGWDKNKEKENKTILLFKDGKSYLAISAHAEKIDWDKLSTSADGEYSKMIYKLLPGPNKMLPKVFFSTKGVDEYKPSLHIIEGYKKGIFKKGDKFDKHFLHELIDFYKVSIAHHPDWSKFGFVFSPTETYDDISAFYNEIANQGYKITFTNIAVDTINRLVDEGKIYLFQIYNKDYAEGAHGKKNLHTLYWENLFSTENLKSLTLKLNGEAELFYRKESIAKPVVHKVGEKLLNKRDKSGMPIPDVIYQELYRFYNGRLEETALSKEAKAYQNNVVVKNVTHEIVKDFRYTKPHFQFHVPFTINFQAQGSERVNNLVNDYLKDNPDVNIIGLDRGERHLIYLTLINQKGEIIKQKTFNTINSMNYQAKLAQREKEREEARRSWQSVGNIKELKEGFLSAVIHEIATMMVEYNAIVVMEDLNFGFKRGRFKVERQVYQKFEKMLIDKLNYLASKSANADEDGGILRGYQLTEKFVSFQKMGKQSGFLFYIPAAYTSKIDPVSGFVNIFNLNDITNTISRKAFFEKFDSIKFISEQEGFAFTFDYDNFKTFQTDYKKRWTISSFGKRIVMHTDNGHKHMADYYPTQALTDAFSKANITLSPGKELKGDIKAMEASKENATFFNELFYAFKATLQMRNSNAETEEDYILSPVMVDGKHFNSADEANKGCKGRSEDGYWVSTLPIDADANGAYHIALKGLYMLSHPSEKIEHEKWFKFAQTKPFKKK